MKSKHRKALIFSTVVVGSFLLAASACVLFWENIKPGFRNVGNRARYLLQNLKRKLQMRSQRQSHPLRGRFALNRMDDDYVPNKNLMTQPTGGGY